jgi:hypothetical protein
MKRKGGKEMKMNHTIMSMMLAVLLAVFSVPAMGAGGEKMKYLVTGSGGPGFTSPEEALEVLEKGILPTFDALLKLQADKVLLAGGLPVGDRALIFILEASSHDEVDRILRDLPAWGVLQWKVKPLQSIEGRAKKEQAIVKELRKQIR